MKAFLAVFLAALTGSIALAVPVRAQDDEKPKGRNPCRVLLQADLEPIFEQKFEKGVEELTGNCLFGRFDVAEPDIVVSLIVDEKATLKQAREVFARGERITRELTQGVETIKGMGDEAYFATLIGQDVLTLRVDQTIAEVRIDQRDDSDATFREQIAAVGDIVEARLIPEPEPDRN